MIGNVWGSPRTTAAGILGIVLAAVGQQLIPALVAYLGGQPGIGWQLIGMALGAIGPALLADVSGKFPAPKGTLVALVVGGLLLASPAHADDPIAFGGCNEAKTFCYGPSISVSVVGISLKSGKIAGGVIPGAGYGVTFFADKPYQLGLAGHAAMQAGPDTTSGMFSGVASFAKYVRLGVGWQVLGGDHDVLALLGLGVDLQ